MQIVYFQHVQHVLSDSYDNSYSRRVITAPDAPTVVAGRENISREE